MAGKRGSVIYLRQFRGEGRRDALSAPRMTRMDTNAAAVFVNIRAIRGSTFLAVATRIQIQGGNRVNRYHAERFWRARSVHMPPRWGSDAGGRSTINRSA